MRLGFAGPSFVDGPALCRRKLLLGAAACGVALSIPNAVYATATLRTLQRRQTGNRTLYPFLLAGQTLYLNGEATLEAWNLANGRQIWQFPLKAPAAFRPRLDEQVLLTAGRAGLAAHRAVDGHRLWEYLSTKELGVPRLHKGRLYIGEGHQLLAFELASGQRVWSFSTDRDTRVAYAPVIYKNTLILGPGDGKLYALDLDNGQLRWQQDRTEQWQYLRQLQLAKDVLIAGGYHDEIYGLRAQTGQILWRFVAGNFLNSQVVTTELVCFWSPTGWIYALDVGTGTVRWRYRTTTYRQNSGATNWAPIAAELRVSGERLFALDMNNELHILDLRNGMETGRYALPAKVRSFISLAPGGQDLFFGTEAGEILKIRLETL